jgi:transcriptional regulator with XRE-family HTH domain
MSTIKPPDIGKNILAIRQANRLSLAALSARCGVSKAMLSQIEQHKTNPTVSIVWKISQALALPLEQLIAQNEPATFELLRQEDAPTILSPDRKVRISVLSPVRDAEKLEIYSINFSPRSQLKSQGHFPGTEEIFTVIQGRVRIEAAGRRAELAGGDTLRYRADAEHIITNLLSKNSQGLVVVKFHEINLKKSK